MSSFIALIYDDDSALYDMWMKWPSGKINVLLLLSIYITHLKKIISKEILVYNILRLKRKYTNGLLFIHVPFHKERASCIVFLFPFNWSSCLHTTRITTNNNNNMCTYFITLHMSLLAIWYYYFFFLVYKSCFVGNII